VNGLNAVLRERCFGGGFVLERGVAKRTHLGRLLLQDKIHPWSLKLRCFSTSWRVFYFEVTIRGKVGSD
jgi:hypothetical protein